MKSVGWNIFIVTLIVHSSAFAESFVPFIIPAQFDPNSVIQFQYSPITEQDRLSAKEHFSSSKDRVRLWGINFTFEANFPTHTDAEQIAQRLACAGINSVRLHHMDTMPWPRGIWNSDSKTLCPEALDRLDYFIDQLAKHGIYVDLNLHVGKEYSKILGLPDIPETHNKMISIFTPQIIEAQKDYARQLLTHQNKYRPWRYADDPAVAIVEITNENSLFMWSAAQVLHNLPPFYADILQQKYNLWLKTKYGSTEKLTAAWSADSIPLGSNLLLNSDLKKQSSDQPAPDKWRLEQHETAKAKTSAATYEGLSALYIEPLHSDGIEWHLQLNQANLKIDADIIYTMTLQIAADKECSVNLGLIQAESPWKNLGLYKSINVDTKWKQVRFTFNASGSEFNGRFNITFGSNPTPFYIASVSLQQGAEFKPNPKESLEKSTVKVFGDNESKTRKLDRMMFFAETEKQFFDGMRNYLKTDLGCKAMITGTIVFGPLGLYAQSDMDFIDAHAYWQHPQWPHKPWDSGDWFIEQKAMTDYPEESTLIKLAAQRLAGTPFTVTEYNHPAPLDTQAQCVPMIASFAAAQDWDGVWLYTYRHTNTDWNRNFLNSYFDIDTNPAKWGFVPAGAAIFRFEEISMLQSGRGFTCGTNLKEMASNQLLYNLNMLRIAENYIWKGYAITVNKRIETAFTEVRGIFEVRPRLQSEIIWPVDKQENNFYIAQSPKAIVFTGYSENAFQSTKGLSKIINPALSTITITTLDKNYIDHSNAILITACGRCENIDMKFSDDRRTVGTNWGKGPVRIETVEGIIDLTKILKYLDNVKVFALNPNGTKKTEVPITDGKIKLSAKYATMWYLVEK
jgi:hypothetical protein